MPLAYPSHLQTILARLNHGSVRHGLTLATGTSGARRLACEVNAHRAFILRAEPDETAVNHYIAEDGMQYGTGIGAIPAHRPAIGVWARLLGWMPGVSSVRMSDPTLQFIEEAEWSDGQVRFKFRGG